MIQEKREFEDLEKQAEFETGKQLNVLKQEDEKLNKELNLCHSREQLLKNSLTNDFL